MGITTETNKELKTLIKESQELEKKLFNVHTYYTTDAQGRKERLEDIERKNVVDEKIDELQREEIEREQERVRMFIKQNASTDVKERIDVHDAYTLPEHVEDGPMTEREAEMIKETRIKVRKLKKRLLELYRALDTRVRRNRETRKKFVEQYKTLTKLKDKKTLTAQERDVVYTIATTFAKRDDDQ